MERENELADYQGEYIPMPKMTVMQPSVENVDGPLENVALEDMDDDILLPDVNLDYGRIDGK